MPKYCTEHGQEAVCVYSKNTGNVYMLPKRPNSTPGKPHGSDQGYRYARDGKVIPNVEVSYENYIVLPDVLEVLLEGKNYVVAAKDIEKFKGKKVTLAADTPAADVDGVQAVTLTKGTCDLHCFGAQADNGDLYDLLCPSAQNTQQGLMQAPPQFQQPVPQQIQQPIQPQWVRRLPSKNLQSLPSNQLYSGTINLRLSDGKILCCDTNGNFCLDDIAYYLGSEDAYLLVRHLRGLYKNQQQSIPVPVQFFMTPPTNPANPFDPPYVLFRLPFLNNPSNSFDWVVRNSGSRDMKDLVNGSAYTMDVSAQNAIQNAKNTYERVRMDRAHTYTNKYNKQVQISFEHLIGVYLPNDETFLSLKPVDQHKLLVRALRHLSDLYQRELEEAVRQGGVNANLDRFFDPTQPMGMVRQKIRAYSAYLHDYYRNFSSSEAPQNTGLTKYYPDGMLFDGRNGFIPGHYDSQTGEYIDGKFRFFDYSSKTFVEFSQQELNEFQQHYCALQNVGATCFMNSTLQMFFHNPVFRLLLKKLDLSKFTPEATTGRYPHFYYLAQLEQMIEQEIDQKKGNCCVKPSAFKEDLGVRNPLFKGIQAGDVKDLIMFIEETIHKAAGHLHTIQLPIGNPLDAGSVFYAFDEDRGYRYSSPINSIFYGINESSLTCQNCQVKKFSDNIYNFLIAPLPKIDNWRTDKRSNPAISLHNIFDHEMSGELMQGDNNIWCNECNQLSPALQQNQYCIETLPNNLTIILNRGKGNVYQVKDSMPDAVHFISDSGEEHFYILMSTANHLGESSMSGHFISHVRNMDGSGITRHNDAITTSPQRGSVGGAAPTAFGAIGLDNYVVNYQEVSCGTYAQFTQSLKDNPDNWSHSYTDQSGRHGWGTFYGKEETIKLPSFRFTNKCYWDQQSNTWKPVLGNLHNRPDPNMTLAQLHPNFYKTAPLPFNQFFNNNFQFNGNNNQQFNYQNNQQVNYQNNNGNWNNQFKNVNYQNNQFQNNNFQANNQGNQFNNGNKFQFNNNGNFNNQQVNYQNNQQVNYQNNQQVNYQNNQQVNYQNNQQFNNFQNNGNNFIKK